MNKQVLILLTLFAIVAVCFKLLEEKEPEHYSYSPPTEAKAAPKSLSVAGISIGMTRQSLNARLDNLRKDGWEVETVVVSNYGEQISGFDTNGLSEGYRIRNKRTNKQLMTVFLEKDESVGLILSEFLSKPIDRGSEELFKPGEVLALVAKEMGCPPDLNAQSELVCKTDENWVAYHFLKAHLYGVTITSHSRAPKETSESKG